MKQQNTEALRWFVEFANLSLKPIAPGDRAKLLVESDCLWPRQELKDYGRLTPLPEKTLSGFSWALKIPGKESPKYWNAIVAAQKAVRRLFAFLQITARPSTRAPSTAVAIVMRGHDHVLWWVGKGPGVAYTLELLPVTESQKNYLRLKILKLLEGFSQHAIRVCPGCKRFFFNPTNREKRFCSERCMRRVCTAEYRETHKPTYNGYQAKLMKDKYRQECKRRQLVRDNPQTTKGESHANLQARLH
jgi:hypothetical protein